MQHKQSGFTLKIDTVEKLGDMFTKRLPRRTFFQLFAPKDYGFVNCLFLEFLLNIPSKEGYCVPMEGVDPTWHWDI